MARDHARIFDAVLDALSEPVLVSDGAGALVFANAAAAQQLGADKLIGLPLAEAVARWRPSRPDGRPLTVAEYPVQRALMTGQPVSNHTLRLEREGAAGWYIVSVVPLLDDGRVTGTVAILRDVTTATRLERELADHAARLEAIVNLVSECVLVVDADGELIFANAVGERFLGLTAGASLEERARRLAFRELEGMPVRPDRFPSTRALRGESVGNWELIAVDAQGQERRIVSSAHPLRTPDGTIYAAVVTMKDVTDDVRVRAELEAARETAEEANRLKDEFIAALSHELRTPLQPILGWTEVLRRHGGLDAVTNRALEAIRRNIRQQVRLVDDLLDLSRIVHGKFALRFETFDLRELVRATAEPFEEQAALKRVHLATTLPPEPLLMWGDGARVQQIATNLIANAVKFTPPGGQVTVQLVATGPHALLEVEDTGEGIPPEDLAIIFEAFRQGGGGGRRGGLGLGLNLVKRLTELHGGSVDVTSEGRGYGTRFQVRLPLALARPLAGPPGAGATRRLDGRSVLVVEDNVDTRDVMKYMLEMEGARVATATTGEEGVSLARRLRPQVVLCDIGLPDIDGLEVARRLRQVDLPGLRLIALTGYGQSDDVRQATAAGFEAHLTKPVNLDQLLTLLTEPAP